MRRLVASASVAVAGRHTRRAPRSQGQVSPRSYPLHIRAGRRGPGSPCRAGPRCPVGCVAQGCRAGELVLVLGQRDDDIGEVVALARTCSSGCSTGWLP
ncbi:hypothetical protein [Ornithinimicrobium kibberense]|uniref:hypothetical protein n=1 Tax=Ornithinimicrobium kibberense TaxID=282060 RepID=UPI00360E2D65